MKRIAFDVDDVLVNLADPLVEFLNKNYGTQLRKDDFTSYELHPFVGCTPEEMLRRVYEFFETQEFLDLKPYKNSQKVISELSDGNELSVITSRPFIIQEKTINWVENYFPKKFKNIFLTNQFSSEKNNLTKADVCNRESIEVLVDDSFEYAQQCIDIGKDAILFTQPWNKKDVLPEKMKRVNDWEEIRTILM